MDFLKEVLMLKVPITFETITPLFTGDCNQKMTEIKPTSIMGSLRFWFEVICHFSGKFNEKEYSKNEFDAKKYSNFIKNKPHATDEDIQRKFELTSTVFYFGCTGWKSQIGIEKIEKNDFTISKLVDSEKENQNLYGKKIFLSCGKKDKNGNPKESGWFLPKQYFWGQFQITFSLSNKDLKDNILFPLLSFIQEYGFLGGKNNIGFGRVKILKPSITNTKMNVFWKEVDYSNFIQSKQLKESELENLSTYISDKIEVIWLKHLKEDKKNQTQSTQSDNSICAEIEKYEAEHFVPFLENIKCLLLLKSKMRKNINNRFQRHYFFGSTKEKKEFFFNWSSKKYENISYPNATKIIPLIREHERGFLAIPGIINMEEINNGTE